MENSRTRNTLLNAIANIFVKFITIITGFVSRTIFIKVLGMEYAGVSGVFTDILTVLSFAELGIGSAITFSLYKPIAENDLRQISKLMRAYKYIYSAISGVILVVGLCLTPLLQYIITDVPNITEDIRVIYILYLINSSGSYLLIYKSTFLTAVQKDYLVSRFKVIVAIFKAIGDCVLLLLFRNFILYLCFNFSITIVQNIMIAKYAEKKYPILREKSKEKLSTTERKKLFKDVRALMMYKISGTMMDGTDSIVISTFVGTTWVGVLGNYNLLIKQLYSFVLQIFSGTSASIGNMSAVSSDEHQERVFRNILFICFWIYCISSTGLWALLNPFMMIWQGEKYVFSNVMVAVLIVEFYIRGMLSPVSQFRNANGLFVQGKYRPLIMALINIAVSIVLAQEIGIMGVILGTIISRVTTQLWYDPLVIYKYAFHKSVRSYFKRYIQYGIITVASCIGTSTLLSSFALENPILNISIGVILSLLIPNFLIILFFHNTEELQYSRQLFNKILKRKV